MHIALQYKDYFKHFFENSILDFLALQHFYPPVFHTFLGLFMFIVPESVYSGVFLNSIVFLVILLFTFSLGKHYFDEKAALLAVFLLGSSVLFNLFIRINVTDIFLTCFIIVAYWVLLRTRSFSDLKFTLLYGVVFSMGMLTKLPFMMYLLLPTLYFLFMEDFYFRQNVAIRISERLRNFFLGVFLMVIITAPWYIYNLGAFLQSAFFYSKISLGYNPPDFLGKATYYLFDINGHFYFPFLLIICVSVIWLFKDIKEPKVKNLLPLFLLLVGSYAFISSMDNRQQRYFIPLLPFIALFGSYLAFKLDNLKGKIFLTVVGITACIYLIITSFDFGQKKDLILGSSAFPLRIYSMPYPPKKENWKVAEIVQDTKKIRNEKGWREKNTVIIGGGSAYFHRGVFRNYAEMDGSISWDRMRVYKRNFGQFTQFFVIKVDSKPTYDPNHGKIIDLLENSPYAKKRFRFYKSYSLPDGSTAKLYYLNIQPYTEKEIKINELESLFKEYFMKKTKIRGDVTVKIGENSQENTLVGKFSEIVLEGHNLLIDNKFPVQFLKIKVKDIQIDMENLIEKGELTIYAVDEVEPSLLANVKELENVLVKTIRELKSVDIQPREGKLNINATLETGGFTIPVEVEVMPDLQKGKQLLPLFQKITLFGIPIPELLYRKYIVQPLYLHPTAGLDLTLAINDVIFENDQIVLNPEP
ncbi:MAG: glycosyltransferase family 39 protein [Nitrospinae bacterium]|nr:glycosyltransferase family 39 protein [Nitrospinota bacterium]